MRILVLTNRYVINTNTFSIATCNIPKKTVVHLINESKIVVFFLTSWAARGGGNQYVAGMPSFKMNLT